MHLLCQLHRGINKTKELVEDEEAFPTEEADAKQAQV
jgi:hypothetical protein